MEFKNPFEPEKIPSPGDVAEWTGYLSFTHPTTHSGWDTLVRVAEKVAAKCRARFDELVEAGAPSGSHGHRVPGWEGSYSFIPDNPEAFWEFTDLEEGLDSQAFQKAWEAAYLDALEAEIRGWEDAEARDRAWIEGREP